MSRQSLAILLCGAMLTLTGVSALLHRDGSGTDDVAQAAQATPRVATTVLSAVPTESSTGTPQPLLLAPSVTSLLTHYLQHEAGSPESRAAWSGRIREVTVGLHTATVRTDLGDSPDDRLLAEEIANAVSRFAASPRGRGINAPDVQVLGAHQQVLANQAAVDLARRPTGR